MQNPFGCRISGESRGTSLLLLVISLTSFSSTATAQETADYFRKNCMNCHTIGGGRLTGPDLKDVTKRKDRDWLKRFMVDPKRVIDSGDPYALKILEESRNVPMPALPGLTDERLENLLDLMEAESKLPTSRFKGLQISNKPFTDVDRESGRRLFLGLDRLTSGGASCISCHSMHDSPGLGGGRLGPDLTKIYERLKGRKALSAWLMAPGTETMMPIYQDRPLTAEEIHSLVAYFESSASESVSDPTQSRVTLLLLGLIAATALIFVLDAIWKRRFQGVRRPLVDAPARPTTTDDLAVASSTQRRGT